MGRSGGSRSVRPGLTSGGDRRGRGARTLSRELAAVFHGQVRSGQVRSGRAGPGLARGSGSGQGHAALRQQAPQRSEADDKQVAALELRHVSAPGRASV